MSLNIASASKASSSEHHYKVKKIAIAPYVTIREHGKAYRLRWKKKPLLAHGYDPNGLKDMERPDPKVLEDYAERELNKQKELSVVEREFSDLERNQLLAKAIEIKSKGINPLDALENGGKSLIALGKFKDKKIKDWWSSFCQHRGGHWSAKVKGDYDNFYRQEKDQFFANKLEVFTQIETSKARKVVKDLFHRNRQPRKIIAKDRFGNTHPRTQKGWQRKSTADQFRSKLKCFFEYLRSTNEGNTLTLDRITDILDKEYIYPKDFLPERRNYAATPQQIAILIHSLSYMTHRSSNRGSPSKPKAGYIVLKCFIGARSTLIHQWDWSIWNREKRQISIPASKTKLKNDPVIFSTRWIPHLEDWLEWAWTIDGCPAPNQPICKCAKETTERNTKETINQYKRIFAIPDREGKIDYEAEIKPEETHHNMLRSAFITYGSILTKLKPPKNLDFDVHKVSTIAEDSDCWDEYYDKSKNIDGETLATEYFSMTPDSYKQYLPDNYKH